MACAWCVTQIGGPTEATSPPPRNGSEADAILDPALEQIMRLYLLNRGLLIRPHRQHDAGLACAAADGTACVATFDAFVGETRPAGHTARAALPSCRTGRPPPTPGRRPPPTRTRSTPRCGSGSPWVASCPASG
jgi:hypothetical protein